MRIFGLFILFLAFPNFILSQTKDLTEEELEKELQSTFEYIENLNDEFRDPEESPLIKDSIASFTELHFFPVNSRFIVRASFEKIKRGKEFEMPTTTDRLPVYRDFAILTFFLEGKVFKLHAYQNVELSKKEGFEDYLFVPFNDHTNGFESYGGGRYMDMRIPDGKDVILNFNKSYNPYCAYNPRYSCPIPPDENKLDIRIVAGVLAYH